MKKDNTKDNKNDVEEESKKMYIEFMIEGVLITNDKEALAIEKKLASMFNKAFKEHKSIRLNSQVAKYYEEELFLSMVYQQGDDGYEN